MSNPNELKLENWGHFFIQRLHHLLQSNEHCDFTIHSTSNDSFKVHRVVLNACSGYFYSLPNSDTSITMPAHLDFNAVKSIIMFMYTGKLCYTEESHVSLMEVVHMLNMPVVLKLLELQLTVKTSTSTNCLSYASTSNSDPKCDNASLLKYENIDRPKVMLKKSSIDKSISKKCSPLALTSKTRSSKPLNKCESVKKPGCDKLYFTSPSGFVSASTFINSMKATDVLTINKPMRFECDDKDALPEFIENTFELPKYDSPPLLKHENINSSKAMLKRTSDGKLIDKNHNTPLIDRDTLTTPLADKKLKTIDNTEQKNFKSKLKIMVNTDKSQFENIIINTPNSVKKLLFTENDTNKLLTMYNKRPDIMNIKGPWSCNLCGTDDDPLKLESYFTFRRHIVEKHYEKEDFRVCEYCGHVSIRKNLQIFHLYTKHNIKPPEDFKLYKCNHCEFLSATDYQLHRHKNLFCVNKPQTKLQKAYLNLMCTECSIIFKTCETRLKHMINVHKINEEAIKKLMNSDVESVQLGAKIILENESLDKIENVVLNDGESLKQTECHTDQITCSEDATEIETLTLEDALQAINEKIA